MPVIGKIKIKEPDYSWICNYYNLLGKLPEKYVHFSRLNTNIHNHHVYINKEIGRMTTIKHTFHNTPLPDISCLAFLQELFYYSNNLSVLKLSKNINLQMLNASANSIETIDITNNKELLTIIVNDNPINKMNISHNRKLKNVSMIRTNIKKIDLNENIFIENVNCNLDCEIVTNKKYSVETFVISGGQHVGKEYKCIHFL